MTNRIAPAVADNLWLYSSLVGFAAAREKAEHAPLAPPKREAERSVAFSLRSASQAPSRISSRRPLQGCGPEPSNRKRAGQALTHLRGTLPSFPPSSLLGYTAPQPVPTADPSAAGRWGASPSAPARRQPPEPLSEILAAMPRGN